MSVKYFRLRRTEACLQVSTQFRIDLDWPDHAHVTEDVTELVNNELQTKNLGVLLGCPVLAKGLWSSERPIETIACLRL